MKKIIYLDSAATTRISPKVARVMYKISKKYYANPSSVYEYGTESKKILEKSRKDIGDTINAKPEEIYITSGGSESNNWAIIGAVLAQRKKGRHIITSKVEHKSVLNICKFLETNGYEISYIDVNQNGIIDLEQLVGSIRKDTILISIMFSNNEVGSIMPIEQISRIAQERGILFHTDAVQAYGHIPIDSKKVKFDMLSASAHKFHGPKGIGFLYIRDGVEIMPLIRGGGQERGMRAGTENFVSVVGMALAAKESCFELDREMERQRNIKRYIITELCKMDTGIHINGDFEKGMPNNISVTVKGIDAVCLVDSLDKNGICVSMGSACNSVESGASYVLKAMNVSETNTKSTIRLSISKYTTMLEIKKAMKIFQKTLRNLRVIYGEIQDE